ncbi:hypothetical protein TNCV_428331 [Trichonephila clavipes]|nr:hypothetical protein TNCV_428331 [Trichonephila clavipes]
MAVGKYIVSVRHGGTLNSRGAASHIGLGSNRGEGVDICKCVSAFAACGYSKQLSNHKSSREVGGSGRKVGGPCLPQGCLFSLKIGVEPNQIALSPVWCSNLQLTTGDQ